ncbi:hypothetical protein L2E82_33607 [Cichorium intybus]|uniref:Uncharacterized protein n=1 Tax=Cichorium intybus TaxID=13427 RepID=A0ACB9BKL0_CICIN|nr:hypothetical protein L2E82_33607 [Cichorium intybus]
MTRIHLSFCDGGVLLDRILSRGGKFTEDDAKSVLIQILTVVAFCHLQGVVHRDLKPENFLYKSKDKDAELKAIDFGLSDFISPDERLDDIVAVQALCHPWIRNGHEIKPPFDISVLKFVKRYICSSSLRKATLRALSKTLTFDELIYMKEQFSLLEPNTSGYISVETFKTTMMKYSTDAMKESCVLDFLESLGKLKYRRMDFEEFCAAALSVHQLAGLDRWDEQTRAAYEIFEKDGNRSIVVEELASELGIAPSIPVRDVVEDLIRQTDGKLTYQGYVKVLHGPSGRNVAKGQ